MKKINMTDLSARLTISHPLDHPMASIFRMENECKYEPQLTSTSGAEHHGRLHAVRGIRKSKL